MNRSSSPFKKVILTPDEDKRGVLIDKLYASVISGEQKFDWDISEEIKAQLELATSYITRLGCIALREHGLDSYPVLLSTPIGSNLSSDPKTDVIQMTVRALPLPDDLTPWEQILEFRSDPSAL